jgi:uncharacterized phosphosugar-binding protein
MTRHLLATAFLLSVLVPLTRAQIADPQRELEKANKQTLPTAVKAIQENTDVKVTLEVDAASFGTDAHAWGNVYIIANRIVGAVSDVGRDQMGKDALEHDVKKIVILRLAGTGDDVVELKSHTVYVRTTASDKAMTVLQNIIVSALEKALQTGHPPPTP